MLDKDINYKQLLEFMMHELRSLHEVLDESATQLSISVKGKRPDMPRLIKHVNVITEKLLVLYSWLSIADFYLEPDIFIKEEKRRISLHEIFYKTIAHLKGRIQSKGMHVLLHGNGKFFIRAHRIISIIPYILLDNAIKYSFSNSKIVISLMDINPYHVIKVTSYGPYVPKNELIELLKPGVRGGTVKKIIASGNGLGLALLKAICDYHGISLELYSDEQTQIINDIPFSEFCVTLKCKQA